MRASQVFEHVTAVFIAGAEIACTGTSEGQAGHFNFAESGHFYFAVTTLVNIRKVIGRKWFRFC